MFLTAGLYIFWVNIHIFYVLGFLVYILDLAFHITFNKEKALIKTRLILGILLLGGNLINPNFIAGALVPMTLLKNFGYMLAENQSLFFMLKRTKEFIYIYYLGLGVAFTQVILLLPDKKKVIRNHGFEILLTISFFLAGIYAIRLIPLFAIAAMTLGKNIIEEYFDIRAKNALAVLGLVMLVFSLSTTLHPFSYINTTSGLGTLNYGQSSAKFFKENNLEGPIFNNYDIESYLIWELYPEEKVFVDNRPEAYPTEFFQDSYIPMQQERSIWSESEKKYLFNSIFYYTRYDTRGAKVLN